MKQIVVASGNQGKIKEIRAKLQEFPVKLISQKELGVTDVPEDGLSFVENAIIKARNASRQTGLSAMADDSGIVVSALNGEPGIYSARYAGEGASDQQNLRKLLMALDAVDEKDRSAYFYCAIVFVQSAQDPTPLIALGRWDGEISQIPSGEDGFGYDPVFYIPEKYCTAAQLPLAEKNLISHRGKALSHFVKLYRQAFDA